MTWKLEIDSAACMASGVCEAVAPKYFTIEGASAVAKLAEIDPDEDALEAAGNLPRDGDQGHRERPRPDGVTGRNCRTPSVAFPCQTRKPRGARVASMGSAGTVPTMAFAEYATGGRHRRTEIVTAQVAPTTVQFYRPILAAIAEAPTDPAALARAVADADLSGQQRAFTEVAEGFAAWWTRARARPVGCATATLRVGDVDVSVAPHLAITSAVGDQVVFFHLKEHPLARDTANAVLRVLQICMPDLLPGATPLVVDARRAREFRLPRNTNLPALDAWLTASASGLATHLRQAA